METDLPHATRGPRIGHLTARRPGPAVAASVREERAKTRAWLHDRVLQILEYVASGGYEEEPDVEHLRRVAALGADELRAFLEGPIAPGGDLADALSGVICEVQLLAPDLKVELLVGRMDADVEAAAVDALVAATREALTNVRRHASATRAIVTCTASEDGVTVAIQDDGTGFVADEMRPGIGVRHSIIGRLLAVGGSARVAPDAGGGTVVTLNIAGDRLDGRRAA